MDEGRAGEAERGSGRGFWRLVFDRWRDASHAIGVVQTRLLMLGVYVLVALPTGLLVRMTSDPLHLREPAGGNWSICSAERCSLERARLQF